MRDRLAVGTLQVEPIIHLRLRNWRRYLSLPLGEMIANPPASCSGNLRISMWMPPSLAPAAVARLLVWHARYHKALGFSCQLTYLYYNQLEAALQDADILQLVRESQLWLVLVEDFFAGSTWLPEEMSPGHVNSTIDDANRGSMVLYVDQMIVNAHSILASIGQNTWLLSIDVDEFLILNQPRILRTIFTECLSSTTSEILRVPAVDPTSTAADGDLSFWLEASAQPLSRYIRQNTNEYKVKSLMRPDDVISFGVHRAYLRHGEELGSDISAGCGIHLLHIENMYRFRTPFGMGNITDWQWALD